MLKEMRYFASQKLLFIKPLIESRVLTAKRLQVVFCSDFFFCVLSKDILGSCLYHSNRNKN